MFLQNKYIRIYRIFCISYCVPEFFHALFKAQIDGPYIICCASLISGYLHDLFEVASCAIGKFKQIGSIGQCGKIHNNRIA